MHVIQVCSMAPTPRSISCRYGLWDQKRIITARCTWGTRWRVICPNTSPTIRQSIETSAQKDKDFLPHETGESTLLVPLPRERALRCEWAETFACKGMGEGSPPNYQDPLAVLASLCRFLIKILKLSTHTRTHKMCVLLQNCINEVFYLPEDYRFLQHVIPTTSQWTPKYIW